MHIPTVLMKLSVEDTPTNIHSMPINRTVDFEMGKDSLEAIIEGLGKIRDQLSKIG